MGLHMDTNLVFSLAPIQGLIQLEVTGYLGFRLEKTEEHRTERLLSQKDHTELPHHKDLRWVGGGWEFMLYYPRRNRGNMFNR